ncbi:GAF domain-containing protein [Hyphobacterium sp. CCMP332]|nr:GAF domain-containing protein [Hyphobacterium sp. CCMP332]
MSEELLFTKGADKSTVYEEIIPQIEALIQNEENSTANMANVAAVLKTVFSWLWVGFYIVDRNDQNLVLGPFQGPLACTRIDFGKGVCGQSYANQETIIVPDVDKFPGHIACSSHSKSEIVVPGIFKNKVYFVLDIDSKNLNEFHKEDQRYLEKIVELLVNQGFRR